jgi:hypothetical protein
MNREICRILKKLLAVPESCAYRNIPLEAIRAQPGHAAGVEMPDNIDDGSPAVKVPRPANCVAIAEKGPYLVRAPRRPGNMAAWARENPLSGIAGERSGFIGAFLYA